MICLELGANALYHTTGDPASQSTAVNWKENMDLIQKAQSAQNGQSRKRRHGPPRTFFMWFTDNSDPSADDIAEVPHGAFLFRASLSLQQIML